MTLGRDLFALNVESMRKAMDLNTESWRKFMAMNEETMKKARTLKDYSGWMELQRNYGQSMWEDAQDWMRAQNELNQAAYTEASSMVREAYAPEAPEPATPPKKQSTKAAA